jgi:hypothetical protein
MTTPTTPQYPLAFVAKQQRSFFTGMIVIEILFPGLFVVAGVALLAAGNSTDLRSVGIALLIPGVALGGGAVIRLLGIVPARANFLTDDRTRLLKRARKFAMLGLGSGLLLSIVAIFVIAFTPWVTVIGGVVGIGAFIMAVFITLLDSFIEFIGERTALRATADYAPRGV